MHPSTQLQFLGQYNMERQTLAKCEKCLAKNNNKKHKYDSRSETNRKTKLDSLKQNKAITLPDIYST